MTSFNYKLATFLLITIGVTSLLASLGSYFSQLGGGILSGPLLYSAVILSVAGLLVYLIKKNPLAAYLFGITFILFWLIKFNLILPALTSMTLLIFIYIVGEFLVHRISNRFDSTFIKFCAGHVSLAVILWIILRFSGYHALIIYRALFILIVILNMIYIFKIYKKLQVPTLRKITLNSGFYNYSLITVFLSFLIYSSLFNFYFDDINGYLYAPIRVHYDGGFIFGPDKPGFMTNMSPLSLGYGSLFSAILGWDRIQFILSFKLFHAASYFFAILLFENSIKNYILPQLRGFLILLIGLVPLIIFEITANYADFYVYLIAMFIFQNIVYITNKNNKINTKFIYLNAFIYGQFILGSLKTIPYIFSYFIILVILILFNYKLTIKKILRFIVRHLKFVLINLMLLCLPLTILLVDNIIKTGNPTFPGGNGLWRSPFFTTIGVVAGRFEFPNMPDGTTFLQIFSYTPQAAQLFSSGNSYFPIYGVFTQTLVYCIPFILLILSFKYSDNKLAINQALNISSSAFLLIISTFIFIVLIIGPQHRYFFGLNIYVICTFIISTSLLLKNNEIEFINSKKFTFIQILFLFIAIFTFLGNGINPPPFKIKNGNLLVSSSNNEKWYRKKLFYDEVNNYIKDDKSILIYYLQDKFFINSKNVYELDWYDFPLMRDLNNTWGSDQFHTVEDKLRAINNLLCKKNFGYAILSPEAVIYDKSFRDLYLKEIMSDQKYQTLFLLKCE